MFELLALLGALAAAAHADIAGTPGHIQVELQTVDGWIEVARPAFQLQAKAVAFSVPAHRVPAGQLALRLSALDNDETQVDSLTLKDGRVLEVRQGDATLTWKLLAEDRDVAEIHGAPLLVRLQAPAKGDLQFELAARSSNDDALPGIPFRLGAGHVVGAAGGVGGPIRLAAEDGVTAHVNSGPMRSISGHPEAPIEARLTVQDGRLKGSVDFALDNDPGDDDFAALVAYDAQGVAHEYKVRPDDTRWGRARWDYGDAAAWQYMRFDLDVPLAELPRDADGRLSLELLAYGTCGTAFANNDFFTNTVNTSATTVPNNITFTVGVHYNTGSGAVAGSNLSISVTAYVIDPHGNTVFTQVQNTTFDINTCNISPVLSFSYSPTCAGTFKARVYSVGVSGDPVPNSPPKESDLNVIGGSPCPTATSTPAGTPTPSVAGNAKDVVVMGPNPVKAGDSVCAVVKSKSGPTQFEIFNSAGERVGSAGFSGSESPCFKTNGMAPGIYWFKIDAESNGKKESAWRKVVLK